MGQGGADRVTLSLLRSLEREKFEVTLVLGRAEGVLLSDVPEHVRVVSLDVRSIWRAFLPLARALREIEPDVVFSTSSGTNITAIIARFFVRKRFRLVLSERAVLYHGEKRIKRRLIVFMKRLFYKRADWITTVSEGVKQDLVQLFQLSPDRIQVVYNPVVTPDLFSLMSDPVDHPWFRDSTPIILAAGRLIKDKDFKTLIDAFARVRSRQLARLVILGEGPLEGSLKRRVRGYSLEKDVWFVGFDKNPFRYMARSTVFVLSSRNEGLPGVLIQAMACGAAVIATDCHAGPSEIITPGLDGWLVPVGDYEALAERMAFLLENPEARQRMADTARRTSMRFSEDLVLTNYVDAFIGVNSEWRRKCLAR